MDGVSSEANEENDNTERRVRRRHSSILKPPRSPLQDLRGGNETVQESNAFRSKKSSRRVSFADTIKVFQTESHMKIGRKSEVTEAEAKENVPFIQSKSSEDNYREITGMNTLLCAPIQTQMQQREFSIIEHNHERKHASDQTVIFLDENQMDLTASHTVMITRDLLDCTKSEKSTKIDTTSFLADLKHHLENSRMKKSNCSVDQNASSEKKINCTDFIKRLKTGKYNASFSSGPDKENCEIPIYSKEANSASSIYQMYVPVNVDENSSNMTRIFREQDDGMNFTQCHTANIQTLIPTSNEANSREFKGDSTIYGNDQMDLTINHTVQILPSAPNLSEIENQTQNVMMNVITGSETKVPGKKTVCKNKQNAAFQNPSLNPEDKICITRSHIIETETHTVTQTSDQDTRTLATTPESVCSSPSIQGYKTVFYSSCNDAMELTKCFSGMKAEENLPNHDGNSKICPNPDGSPLLLEKTIYSEEDNMDITKSHTVAIDNQILKQDQTNVQITGAPISEKEMVLSNNITVSEYGKINVSFSSVPHVPKEKLQQNLANPLSISLTNEKTELLAGENMDLTEGHISNLESQGPLASNNLVPENISKSNSHSKNTSEEWGKITKSHIKPSQQPNIISKDIATNHNIVNSGRVLDKQRTLRNNKDTVSSEQPLFSTMKPLYSTEEQSAMKTYNTAVNSHTVKSILGQNSKLPEPLKKNVSDCTSDYSHERMIICSEEEQNMDLTKSHTVVIGFGSSEIQELDQTNLKHTTNQVQRTTTTKQRTTKFEKCNKSPIEKSRMFVSNNIMDVSEDKNVQKPEFLKENKKLKCRGRKSVRGLKHDKSVIFSEGDENDMDITKSYTVEISHRPPLDEHDSHLVPLPETSKTILYSCGQDDMEITRSHTTALECKTVLPDEITALGKTVMFVDDQDELEMTKCHTVFIDFQVRPDVELSKRKSLRQSKVTYTAEESVFFPECDKSDHKAAKSSHLTVLEERPNSDPAERAIAFITDDNMEVSKSTTLKNIKDVQKPGFLNEPLPGKSQRRKSLRLTNDKTVVFPENDKNDLDITQTCMVDINNRSALEDRNFHLVPSTGTSKTILYSCGQDDMEITRSHTTALVCKTVLPDETTTRPVDKTVVFVDNQNDLEVTKSHTVFIDFQATEKIFHENPKFGIAKEKNLDSSFAEEKKNSHVQEIPKKQELATENKIFLHTEQEHHMIPIVPTNILSGDQSEVETMKSCRAATDGVMGKGVGQVYTLEKAKVESCHLDSTDRKNVDFTSSHVTTICGSNDYSCLPDVSCFNNLEGNVMSLCGKDKEKANNCPMQNDLAYADSLPCEHHMASDGLTLSAPCPLLEKQEAIQTNTKGQLHCAITLPKDQDLIKEPQNLLANQTQNLGEMTKLNSKRVSFRLPKNQMEGLVDTCVASEPHLPNQQPLLLQKGQSIISQNDVKLPKAGDKSLNIVTGISSASTYENKSKILNNKEQFAIACKELKENSQTAKSKSDLTVQVIQTHCSARQISDPVIVSDAPCFSSVKQNLNNLNGKTEGFLDFQTVHKSPPPEQSLKLGNETYNGKNIVQATEIHNIVSSNVNDTRGEENKSSHKEAEATSVPLKTAVKDKMRRCSLGIFLPRLPNKRNCGVTVTDDLEQIPANINDLNHLETQPVSSEDPGTGSVAAKLNLSPSQYINEENLPLYPGEVNSLDSICIDIEDKTLIETYQKENSPSENKLEETCNRQKRTLVQKEDSPNEKKFRKTEIELSDTTQDQEVFDHHTEGDIDRNANSVLIKSLSRTPSTCSSSLDSVKADGTSLDFSTHRNSQMESQFLRDTICEESLREKLKDGRITVREFFILLQVHILIQKPRQSNLPAKFTISTTPTPEDLMLRQYVYGPKIEIYREDCEVLRQKIEELKLSALNQDKLLTDINRNLWEKMRCCSDEELKAFGIYLNKIKSRFTKMTKVFTHQGKVALYSKLVHSAQNEREKLQIRIDEMNDILKKINNCLTDVEKETNNLEDEEKENPIEEWSSEMRAAEKELEQLKTEEEELQRNLAELEIQRKQTLAQIDLMQKQTSRTKELLDQLSLSEWDVIEWSDDQAVFNFVYDTIELTITFGEPVVGLPFLDKACRKITELNFQSLLDESKAPPSSLLVHKLIFQYIEEQESWKKKCTTQHQVPKMLQEFSLVVNHCRLLGEEIEFLKRWGTNYNLMNIDVKNTELTLLFASSAAFAKFEITLSLSAHYPSVPLPFMIQNHIGNTGQDEIATILSKVSLEDNYLKNVVKQIYQDLFQDCHFYH